MATNFNDTRSPERITSPNAKTGEGVELKEPLIPTTVTEEHADDPSNQQAQSMLGELLKFEVPMSKLERASIVQSYKTIVKECLGIFPSIIGPPLVNAMGIVSINMTNRPDIQATFGLFNSYTLMFTIAVELSLMDKLGIDLSTSFGAKDYYNCKRDLTKGLIINLIFFSLGCAPMMMFSEGILTSVGIAAENAVGVQRLTSMYIPVIFFIFVAEMLKTFCMAQGLEHYFGKIGMVNNGLNIIFNYVTIVHFGYGAEAIVIGRGIFSFTEILCGFYFVVDLTKRETRGLVTMQEALVNFRSHFLECLSFVFGTYSEFIGFEIATYFVALLHNNNMISAYSAVIAISGVIYCTGMAFAIICRTRINILIGMKKFEVACNYFDFFVKSAAGTGIVIGLVSAAFTPWVAASFASSNDEMYGYFVVVYLIYCSCMGSETSIYSSFVGIKTVGKVRELVKLNCITMIGFNGAICALCYFLRMGPGFTFLSVMSCLIVLNYLCYKTTIESDWSVAKVEEGPAEPESKELQAVKESHAH